MTTAPSKTRESTVRHFEFCPVFRGEEPRVETFPYLGDDPDSGRTRHTHDVTRCMDCGDATYTARS